MDLDRVLSIVKSYCREHVDRTREQYYGDIIKRTIEFIHAAKVISKKIVVYDLGGGKVYCCPKLILAAYLNGKLTKRSISTFSGCEQLLQSFGMHDAHSNIFSDILKKELPESIQILTEMIETHTKLFTQDIKVMEKAKLQIERKKECRRKKLVTNFKHQMQTLRNEGLALEEIREMWNMMDCQEIMES